MSESFLACTLSRNGSAPCACGGAQHCFPRSLGQACCPAVPVNHLSQASGCATAQAVQAEAVLKDHTLGECRSGLLANCMAKRVLYCH